MLAIGIVGTRDPGHGGWRNAISREAPLGSGLE